MTERAHEQLWTDAEKLAAIKEWMHPGLWSGLDGRRDALLKILAGELVRPPAAILGWKESPTGDCATPCGAPGCVSWGCLS